MCCEQCIEKGIYSLHDVFPSSSSRLHAAVDTVAELLRSYPSFDHRSELKYSKTLPITLQNAIITLRHKTDIVTSLLRNEAFSPNSFVWKNHILYSTEGDIDQTSSDHDVTKKPSTRTSTPSANTLGSNVASPKTSCSSLEQQSLFPSQKLQGSAHNLVASSRSLLNSRHTLLGNGPSRAGTSSPTHTPVTRSTKCMVQCSDIILPYGYELSACDSKLVLTPVTEACLVSLVTAIRGHTIPCISGKAAADKSETAKEAAKVFLLECSVTVQLMDNLADIVNLCYSLSWNSGLAMSSQRCLLAGRLMLSDSKYVPPSGLGSALLPVLLLPPHHPSHPPPSAGMLP